MHEKTDQTRKNGTCAKSAREKREIKGCVENRTQPLLSGDDWVSRRGWVKIYRFSISLVFVTLLALLYVHQQVQLLKISYKINANEKNLSRLLDHSRALIYNITSIKSPVNLDKRFLASKKDYLIPQQWQIVEVATPKGDKQAVMLAKKEKGSSRFFKLFGRPREAFANTVPNAATREAIHRHPED